MVAVKRPSKNPHPTAQEEYAAENGHPAKNIETAKKAYNPDNLSEEKKNAQHQAIFMSKHFD